MDHLKPREWKLRTPGDSVSETFTTELAEEVSRLSEETGLSPLTVRVLMLRGMADRDAVFGYLNPRLDQLQDPHSICDMDRAVERLAQARFQREKVLVFGDYDVDGTTGAALLSWVFRDLKLNFTATQPDRFKDGYGLNPSAVEAAAEAGVRVIVSVDCGISSFEAAEKAKGLGMDLIVMDHHQVDPSKGLPEAYAICDPQREDCESGLKQLCGCGLAFYYSLALRAEWRRRGWFEGEKEPNLKQHLDLVVMATAADQVPLTGDNRILVKHGMDVLKQSRKPGVKALMEVAGLANRSVSPGHLGFVLGPRINASGRMQSASLALKMLTTEDSVEGIRLAHELEKLNQERADLQNAIWDEVKARVEEGLKAGKFQNGIVVSDPNWHEGVVGIVASKVTETFRRPAVVIAQREDFGKGSVRSYGKKDVLAAVRGCKEHLLGFGGHRYAAGLSVENEKIEAFTEAFDRSVGEITGSREEVPLLIEGSCTIADLDLKTLQEIEMLGPFGPGNPEPVFSIKAEVRDRNVLKGRHLKLNLASVGSERSHTIEAIWFNGVDMAPEEGVGDAGAGTEASTGEAASEWAGVPELNRFRGRVTPTFRIRDRK